jgi:hypothetical protein
MNGNCGDSCITFPLAPMGEALYTMEENEVYRITAVVD